MFGTSVCHQNVQETNTETNHEAAISLEMFCDICWKVCGENCLGNGTLEIDFSTRIMPLLTALSLQEFQANNGMTVAPHPPSYIQHPIAFLCFQTQAGTEMRYHDIMIQEQSQTTSLKKEKKKNRCQQMLPAVAYHGLTLSSYKEVTLERTEFKTGKHHYQ